MGAQSGAAINANRSRGNVPGLLECASTSRLWRLALVLPIVLCLIGCNTTTSTPVEIYFVAQSAADLQEYVARFEAAHPGIKVHVSYRMLVPDDWPRHFDAALLRNAPVMSPDQAALLLDLMPLIEADPGFGVGDYYPGALAAGDLNGRRVTIPVGLEFDALVYDPSQLSAAGAASPTPGWTWEEMVDIARTVGRYRAAEGSGAVFVNGMDRTRALVNWIQQQSPIYQEMDGKFLPLLDRPELRSVVLEASSASAELTAAAGSGVSLGRSLSYLQANEAVMTEYPLFFFVQQRAHYQNLAVTALPQPNLYRDMRASGGLSISRGTTHAQAAWQWIRFLSQQSGIGASFGGSDLPARKSVAAELQVWENMGDEASQVIETILAAQDGTEHGENHEPLWFIVGDLAIALQQIYDESVDPDQALATAQREATNSVSAWYDAQDSQMEQFVVIPPVAKDEETAAEVLLVSVQGPDQEIYVSWAKEFEASHPGWVIQTEPQTAESPEADCLLLQVSSYYSFVPIDMRSVIPVDSIGELNSCLTDDVFYSQALDAISWHGQLLGVPLAVRPLALYYDADVFDRAGLAPPTAAWTVADVLDAAEALSVADPTLLGYAPRDGTEVRFVLEQQGIPLFSDETYPQPRFTAPDVVREIERLRALQGGTQVVSSAPTVMEMPVSTAGKPLGYGISSVEVVALQPHPGTRWPVEVSVGAASRQNTHLQMAWEWITFLAARREARTYALPAVRSMAGEQAHQTMDDDLYTAYSTALERMPSLPERDGTVIENTALWWFNQAMADVGAGDLQAALEQAQARAEQFVDCVAATGMVEDTSVLATCARQVDPEHWLARMAP